MNAPIELQAPWQGETPLVCIARTEETQDCATFELAAPTGQPFDYFPGQFVSVGAEIDGRTHWRAYSISSSPTQPETLSITVKRVQGGLVSNWLLDHWRAGMRLPALAPAGEFGVKSADLPRTMALFSAGSGITPMMSIARWLLESNADVQIHFFHSARNDADLIFARELLVLDEGYSHFHLHLFLTRPQGTLPCLAGRMDAVRMQALLPRDKPVQAWLCGQAGYMDDVTAWLKRAGLNEADIFRESFEAVRTALKADAGQFELNVPALGKTMQITAGETLLDVMEREGLPILGACRTGVCGSCKCKVEAGQVESSSTLPLTPEEIEAGYVLACSASACSDLTITL